MDGMLARLIGEDVDLVLRPDPQLWPVKVDAAQFEQIVLNLVVNARDAMPTGGRLTIETANVAPIGTRPATRFGSDTGEHVLLAVSDTGCGMDAATRERIFEPFFTTKSQGQGTGLGLAMVYGIIEQSGGRIEVLSEPRRGTTFKVYLPPSREEASTPAAEDRATGLTRGEETVLLAEDEDGVRDLARLCLERNGYQVLEAGNGSDALRICEQYPGAIDILVTDVVMPHLSGRQVAERVLSRRPRTKVLYVSGYTDDAMTRHGVADAGTSFLPKPFTAESLARKVREVLDR
jgi:CheY-like chemotaxis protein